MDENNQRKSFWKKWRYKNNLLELKKNKNCRLKFIDILNKKKLEEIFRKNKFDLIVHAIAQPSHDWSASNPNLDFHTNAVGTLNMLECVRKYTIFDTGLFKH